ncbi:MAG: FkbM family methyltransferase [Verrucomicrobia bacterium]|nr:FkbM family methyltransferase [Verrucomicrobiota bacterium]
MSALIHKLVLILKTILYSRSGEPYSFGGKTLRFTPGSRPVRTKYRDSTNANVRNDALQVDLVLSSLKEGDTSVDIGAHVGQYGVLMSACCGSSGQVICFEPDPDALTRLKQNIALNPMLKSPQLVHAACSDTNGTATFFTQGGNSQSSLAKSALPQDRATKEISVSTFRLDDWWAKERSDVPAFVKIDTEGAEIHVLRGMPKILASNAKIVCELHPFAWDEFGVTFQDLETIIVQSGRTMKWLDGRGAVQSPGEYGTVIIERA